MRVATLLGLLLVAPLAAQQPGAPLRLIRCGPSSASACLTTTIRIAVDSSVAVGGSDSLSEMAGWSATLGDVPLIGPGVMRRPEEQSSPERSRSSGDLQALRVLTFGLDPERGPELGRSSWTGRAQLRLSGTTVASVPLQWRPPLFATPIPLGTASPAQLTPRMREVVDTEGATLPLREIIAALLLVTIAGLWLFVPRLIWIRGASPELLVGRPAEASETQRMAALGRGIVAGEEVQEAAPRHPGEVTRETARRSARRR